MEAELQRQVLGQRVPIRVSGKDAQKLLNDVLTSVLTPGEAQATWWALLSPQGKIQAEGLGFVAEDGIWLDVHESVAEAFFKRMRLYKLRADVVFEDLRQSHDVTWSAEPVEDGPARRARLDMGWMAIIPKDLRGARAREDGYLAALIGGGLSELGEDYAPDVHFPHDVGMDLVGGVDFTKGCYVGQEVVSRMQHRGTARRRPVIVSGAGLGQGAALEADGREIGVLGRVAGGRGVAIVRIDRVTDPASVTCNGTPVHLALPEWANYRFGKTSSDDSESD
jgi:tRNA-modifying protein YgfZ